VSVGNDGIFKVWEDTSKPRTVVSPTPKVNNPAAPIQQTQEHHVPVSGGNPVQHSHSAPPGDTFLDVLKNENDAEKLRKSEEEKAKAKAKLKEEFAKNRLRPKKNYGGIEKKPRGISYIDLEFVLSPAELPLFKDAQKAGSVYSYLEPFLVDSKIKEIYDCISSAKADTFTVIKDVKSKSGIAEKLFLRNKPLNDVVRCMVICSDEANGPDDFMQFLGKLKEDSKNYFSYWVEDDTGKAGWGTYKVFVYYTQFPGKVFPIEVQFVSKTIYDLEKAAQTHLDYESLRQSFGALSVYEARKVDHISLFKEIPDLNGVWEKYIINK